MGGGSVMDRILTQILHITADVQYNNSVIQCRSFTSGEGVTLSAPALLMVQGMYIVYPCIRLYSMMGE